MTKMKDEIPSKTDQEDIKVLLKLNAETMEGMQTITSTQSEKIEKLAGDVQQAIERVGGVEENILTIDTNTKSL